MIIPIGRFCGIVIQLKRLGLRRSAYPFDWMVSDLNMICDCIRDDFKDFFDVEPEDHAGALNNIYYMVKKYKNKNKGIGFPHHDMSKPEIKTTFYRRIDRWKEILSTSIEKIIFAHTTFHLDMNEVNRFITTIQEYYPKLNFHVIIIHEFSDENVDSLEKEYVHQIEKQELFTIYNIHMKIQQQAIVESSNKFYDTIFQSYIS